MNDQKEFPPNKELDEEVPLLCSQRWILAYIGFVGFGVVYSLRVNISVAIVCMVKNPFPVRELNVWNATNFTTTAFPVDISCPAAAKAASHSNDRAELDWSAGTKSSILASFFYGYILTQVPSGWLADRYGGKNVMLSTIFLSSVLTILMPVCARASVYLVYVIRVLLGLLTAANFPAMHAMWGRWAPPLERSKLTALCYAGTTLGNVVTFSTSGLLCAYGFDNGWGSIFYITGILGVLWSVAWFYIAADTPRSHPRIKPAESHFITSNLEYNTEKRWIIFEYIVVLIMDCLPVEVIVDISGSIGSLDSHRKSVLKNIKVPWIAIAKAPCFWACLAAQVCSNWTTYTLLTNIPTFMKEVLKFDIKANGALSSVPYICQFVSAILSGIIADTLRSREIFSTTATRKIFQTIAFLGAGSCLIGTGFCNCEYRALAVVLLSLAVTFMGVGRAGYVVNHVDFAPKYAGVLFGITNTFGTIPGMTAPLLTGYLTPNNTPEEWRTVFYVCAGFDAFGFIIFGLFASGDLQDWAKDELFKVEIEVKAAINEVQTPEKVEKKKLESIIGNVNRGMDEIPSDTKM